MSILDRARANVRVLLVACFASSANARAEPASDAEVEASPDEGAARPAGLSLSSTSGVILRNPTETTLVQMLGIAYAVNDSLSVSMRVGAAHRSGGGQPAGAGVGNILLTGTVTKPIGKYVEVSGGLSTTLPTNALGEGTMASDRFAAELSASDWFGTIFLPNYIDLAPGAGITLTVGRVSAHLQLDVHEMIRVRSEAVDSYDAAATALAPDLSLTYRVLPALSVFAHLSEFRVLTTPRSVMEDPSSRTQDFVSGGVAIDIDVGAAKTFTGTIMYARPITGPLTSQRYQAIELDLAFAL